VVWREGGGNIGWFPMPPGDNYYGDGAYRDNFSNQYGYSDWYGPSFSNDQFMSLWIFVGQDHFRDRNFRNYAVPQRNYGSFFSQTTNTTNYVTINNYVVNRSVDRGRLERATNQRLEQVPARSVIGPKTIVTQVGEGRQVEQRERQRRPIPASIDRSDQRGRDNLNTNAQEQKANQPQPRVQDRDNDRGRDEPDSKARVQSNLQTDRDSRVTNTRPPNSGAAGQGLAERRNRDAEVPTIQVTPTQKRGSQANTQTEVVVQNSRPSSRVQGKAPDAGRQGNTGTNQTRANRQGDTKNTDEEADDKKTRADRRGN